MRFFVVRPFTLETPHEKVTLPAGKILELSQDQAARLLQAGFITKVQSLDEMQREYFRLLAHWWDDATEELPDAEVERMLSRLDTLYRELHRQGCRVPVRLPVEKNNSSAERRGEDHSTWTLSN